MAIQNWIRCHWRNGRQVLHDVPEAWHEEIEAHLKRHRGRARDLGMVRTASLSSVDIAWVECDVPLGSPEGDLTYRRARAVHALVRPHDHSGGWSRQEAESLLHRHYGEAIDKGIASQHRVLSQLSHPEDLPHAAGLFVGADEALPSEIERRGGNAHDPARTLGYAQRHLVDAWEEWVAAGRNAARSDHSTHGAEFAKTRPNLDAIAIAAESSGPAAATADAEPAAATPTLAPGEAGSFGVAGAVSRVANEPRPDVLDPAGSGIDRPVSPFAEASAPRPPLAEPIVSTPTDVEMHAPADSAPSLPPNDPTVSAPTDVETHALADTAPSLPPIEPVVSAPTDVEMHAVADTAPSLPPIEPAAPFAPDAHAEAEAPDARRIDPLPPLPPMSRPPVDRTPSPGATTEPQTVSSPAEPTTRHDDLFDLSSSGHHRPDAPQSSLSGLLGPSHTPSSED